MSFDLVSSALFGQTEETSSAMPYLIAAAKILIAIPLPVMAGVMLARWLRMKDYGWRLAIIFCSLCMAAVFVTSFPLRLGVDLKGGVILVYEIDQQAVRGEGEEAVQVSSGDIDWNRLILRLTNRINPSGTKEIVVRRYGDWQIEIIIPDVDPIEVERIKKQISTAGSLEFRIVANTEDHEGIISLAEAQAQDSSRARSKFVTDDDGVAVAYWARVGREQDPVAGGIRPLKVQAAGDTIRNASTGEILIPDLREYTRAEHPLEQWLRDEGIKEIDILMATDDEINVTGDDLGMVSRGYDEVARPCVKFNMKGQGIGKMGALTRMNLPEEQREFYRRLGIMLDGVLLSAPRVMSVISDQGQITGQFTQEEVDFLVGILQAGSLPAALNKVPISENQIGAVLGEDTIEKGQRAIVISLGIVLVFILIWYRFAGIVACLALAANLLLILALMKFPLRAPLTLPGLAGLVLTVGMSVDANVLIFERIREELERGSALRMAIRNGFSRATTTIVDANLTTLITALVLYVIGTDQIRGFAVTLILGILMSMFTAIFCSRVVFDIFERTRRITSLKMMRLVGATHIDFIGKRKVAIAASAALIVIGLAATVTRGKQIFDIDFLGGTSVTMVLRQVVDEGDIRTRLDEEFSDVKVNGSSVQYSVNSVDVRDQPKGTVWKIDSSLEDVEQLESILEESFPVATHEMSFGELAETRVEIQTPPEEPADDDVQPPKEPAAKPDADEKPAETPGDSQPPTSDSKAKDKPAEKEAETTSTPDPEPKSKPAEEPMADAEPDDESAADETAPADESKPTAEPDDAEAPKAKKDAAPADKEAAKTEAKPAADEIPEEKPEPKPAPGKAEPAGDAKPSDEPEVAEGKPAEEESDPKSGKKAESDDAEPPDESEEPAADPKEDARRDDLPEDTMLAMAGLDGVLLAQADPKEDVEAVEAEPETTARETTPDDESTGPETTPDDETTGPATTETESAEDADDASAGADSETTTQEPPAGDATDSQDDGGATTDTETEAGPDTKPKVRLSTQTELTFDYEINGRTLEAEILEAAKAVDTPLTEDDVRIGVPEDNPDWSIDDSIGYTTWNVTLARDQASAEAIFDQMREKMIATPVWSSSSKIGGKVAGDTRLLAVYALLASLLGIVIYIWVRFQRVIYGLAAVVALVHDVLITLGAIAVSYWLAGLLGFLEFLQIEEFKISLPVVAAFLTIIGYSLNDTIVVFDRIREVRGKSPNLTEDMVNTSINQTLSRTLLTSFTTFVVVVILYFLGGAGIHGFAFALVVGVIVGTYSSIFVASPALLWMSGAMKASDQH
jgi:SecD/SecF fusion protein